ncbi:MAG: AAA family ATPase [archaeon]
MINQIEFPKNITLIFGPSASGKTTLCLQKTATTKGKVIFIDTENSFTPDRLIQMNPEINLDNIILIKATRYSEQFQAVKKLQETKNISLVVIDSFTKYYRKKIQEKVVINPPTIKQLQLLRDLHIPILLTSQVYCQGNTYKPLATHLWRTFSKQTIELQKDHYDNRKMILNNKETKFKITDKGLTSFS